MNRSYTIYTSGKEERLLFVRTHPDAVLPKRNHKQTLTGDTGYDIASVEDTLIPAKGAAIVPVGLKMGHIPPGFWIRIESRSGLQFKHGLQAFGGIIDNQYRGDMGIRILNHSHEDYTVKKGDRVAQLVLYPLIALEPAWTEQATDTHRGENGFGSSGK